MHILALILAFAYGAYRTRVIWMPVLARIVKWADERHNRAATEARERAEAEARKKAEEERHDRFHTYPYGKGAPERKPRALPPPDEAVADDMGQA